MENQQDMGDGRAVGLRPEPQEGLGHPASIPIAERHGEWHLCGDGHCSCKTVSNDHFPIAKITVGDWGDDYPALRLVDGDGIGPKAEAYMEQITYGSVPEELAQYYARLISRAPKFLAAVRGALLHEKGWRKTARDAIAYIDTIPPDMRRKAVAAFAQGIEAAMPARRDSGSTEGESPAPPGDAPHD